MTAAPCCCTASCKCMRKLLGIAELGPVCVSSMVMTCIWRMHICVQPSVLQPPNSPSCTLILKLAHTFCQLNLSSLPATAAAHKLPQRLVCSQYCMGCYRSADRSRRLLPMIMKNDDCCSSSAHFMPRKNHSDLFDCVAAPAGMVAWCKSAALAAAGGSRSALRWCGRYRPDTVTSWSIAPATAWVYSSPSACIVASGSCWSTGNAACAASRWQGMPVLLPTCGSTCVCLCVCEAYWLRSRQAPECEHSILPND